MNRKVIISKTFAVIVFLLSVSVFLFSGINSAQASDTILGGIPYEGNLKITVLDDGSIGIDRFISEQWQNQIFAWDNKGSRLQINETGYSLGYFYGLPAVFVSNTKLSDNQITAVWTAGGMRITLDLTYQNGAAFMGLRWALTNESGNTMSDIRFFHGEDTFYFGDDHGAGYWDDPNTTIGVQKHVGGELKRMSLQAVNTPYAYDSMNYYSVLTDVNAGALTKTIDANESTDNGYALEWRKDTMQNGETWTITAYEKFADVSVGTVSVTAPILTECNIGGTCDLTYTVINISSSAANVDLSLISNDRWPAVIISPAASIIIPAGGSQAVIVRVTVPNNVSEGTISHITLNANDGTVTAGDTAAVKAIIGGFTLTVNKTGTGDGTVTGAGTYNNGTVVDLTATANPDSIFTGWSGDPDCSDGQVTVNADITCTAIFTLNVYTVSTSAGTGGSISPASATVYYGNTTQFAIAPIDGYHIQSVSGCGGELYTAARKKKKKKLSAASEMTYTTGHITENCTVTASFAKDTFTVAILKSGTGSGTITGNGITCEGNACGGTFEAGSKLILKIKPDDGYRVIDVKINGKSIGPVQTITLKEIMSNFTIEIVFGPISP